MNPFSHGSSPRCIDSGVFQRVDLKSSSHIPDGTGFARQFQIECSYEDRP